MTLWEAAWTEECGGCCLSGCDWFTFGLANWSMWLFDRLLSHISGKNGGAETGGFLGSWLCSSQLTGSWEAGTLVTGLTLAVLGAAFFRVSSSI